MPFHPKSKPAAGGAKLKYAFASEVVFSEICGLVSSQIPKPFFLLQSWQVQQMIKCSVLQMNAALGLNIYASSCPSKEDIRAAIALHYRATERQRIGNQIDAAMIYLDSALIDTRSANVRVLLETFAGTWGPKTASTVRLTTEQAAAAQRRIAIKTRGLANAD